MAESFRCHDRCSGRSRGRWREVVARRWSSWVRYDSWDEKVRRLCRRRRRSRRRWWWWRWRWRRWWRRFDRRRGVKIFRNVDRSFVGAGEKNPENRNQKNPEQISAHPKIILMTLWLRGRRNKWAKLWTMVRIPPLFKGCSMRVFPTSGYRG